MSTKNLNTVTLIDGLPTTLGADTVYYKTVILRPATVAMDLRAVELSERIVYIEGKPKLLLSDEMYRVAMTMLRIERFVADGSGLGDIDHPLIDLKMMGRLSPQDLEKIEQQTALMDLAAQVRYGNITQEEFDDFFNATPNTQKKESAPQPTGEAGDVDEHADQSRPAVGRLD